MNPILLKGNKGFDENEFREYLISKCNKMKNENRALAFAFIVYDFKDHTINKILKDHEYWNRLDIISGNLLSIFYLDSQDYHYKKRLKEIEQERISSLNDNEKFHNMIYLNVTPVHLESVTDYFKKEFNIHESIRTPFIIFFQTDGKNILDYFVIPRLQKIEDSFWELQAHVEKAVTSISKVTSENCSNYSEIFELIVIDIFP